MNLYYKFRNSSLDIAPLGLYEGPDCSDSVFTPSGARVLAWLNNHTKIHFCQIDAFGETVFAVDPEATPGDCVHPVARDIPSFIGLLVHCKNAAIVAGSYQWSRQLFDELIRYVKPGMKARSVMQALENLYHPPVIEDAYGAMEALRNSFDYRTIPLHQDYFEWCPIRPGRPKWEVGFDTGFSDYCQQGQAGKELAVKRSFLWQGEDWGVPAVYLCESGIVTDCYMEVPADRIRSFLNKWDGRDEQTMSVEDQMYQQLENPLFMDTTGLLLVNDKEFRCRKTFSLVWNPYESNSWQARRTLEHYALDRSKGYLLRRMFFQRKGKYPPIRTLQLVLGADPVCVPGQRFLAPEAGESLRFTHPDTGIEHTLTVISQTREALNPNFLSNHPCCYTKLAYELNPILEPKWVQIADCDPGDPWKGSPDGPSAMFFTGQQPAEGFSACSSLRYTPAKQISWRMIFRQKLRPDIRVRLLP